ncbi:MAG: SDR family oxidoreductase [Anaerolineae bacterium]|nr:SDR family oxidoreductase [Anaerolineae bacterium]
MYNGSMTSNLVGKNILITGGARRIGRHLALSAARHGANIIIHHAHSPEDAAEVCREAHQAGVQAAALTADLNDAQQAAGLVAQAALFGPLYALINNAAIFEPFEAQNTGLEVWQRHLNINLTAPFLLSQTFAGQVAADGAGRIINLLDWRALRPGKDHFAYTVSKAGLAAMTQSMAAAYAPRITVNALALGAILPPADGGGADHIIQLVPAGRWATLEEVWQSVLFLLDGPSYITGEIIHLDGGRHLI